MSLARDTVFYTTANWGVKLAGLITFPVLLTYFSPQEFGYISLVNIIASICSVVGIMAVADQGLPRFFVDATHEHEKTSYTSSAFLVSGLGTACVVLLIIASTPFVSYFLPDIKKPIYFTGLIAITCFAQSIHSIGSNMLKWTFQSNKFMKLSLFRASIATIVTISGIVFWGWRVQPTILTIAISMCIAGFCACLLVRNYISISAVSREKIKILFVYSWPLLCVNIFASFTRSLDRIFLATLGSLQMVGIFSVAATIASVFEILTSGFLFAWGPHVIKTYRNETSTQRYSYYFNVFTLIGILCIILLGLWSNPIINLFRPDHVYGQIGVFIPWIVSGTLLYYLGNYFALGPVLAKKTYWRLITFVIAATSNAVLNLVLIPRFGILGAGLATTFSSLFAAILSQIISNKLFFLPNRWIYSFSLILAFTVLVSFSQHSSFATIFKMNNIVYRILITLLLTSLAIISFYKDIQDSRVIGTISKKIVLKRAH
jgi:O-antigen/teichoic acid export membrane protein